MSTEPVVIIPAELPEAAEYTLDDAVTLLCRYGLSREGAFTLIGQSMIESGASVSYSDKRATVDFDPDSPGSQYFYIEIEESSPRRHWSAGITDA